MSEFEKVFNSYKKLTDDEKKQAIIEYLRNNINAMQTINKDINNDIDSKNLELIIKEESNNDLDIIYKLLNVMTEQVEMFTEKISTDFYE